MYIYNAQFSFLRKDSKYWGLMHKTMEDKSFTSPIVINKITPSIDHNYRLLRLDTTSLKPTNHNLKHPSFKPTYDKCILKNLGTSEIYSPTTSFYLVM